MFEFLFNQSQAVWRDGDVLLQSGIDTPWFAAIAVAFVAMVALSMLRLPISLPRRLVVAALQFGAAAVLLFMLAQPALKVDVLQDGENTVAYVLDGSRSMTFPAGDSTEQGDGVSRVDTARAALSRPDIADNTLFDASRYVITDELSSVENFDDLPDASDRSALSDSLLALLEAVNDQSLAAVVLASDGANNIGELSSDWWQRVRQSGVPVHTLGVGPIRDSDDIELSDVLVQSGVTPDSTVRGRVIVRHGDAGSARLRITSGNTLLLATDLILPAGTEESTHRFAFRSGEEGIREIRYHIERSSSDGGVVAERNTINNAQSRVLSVTAQRKRVLYVEGEPRWEYKFIRRALHKHPDVEIVSLLRTSPNKFYRQGVQDADELADGFPVSRDELYRYDAVIIGSLDAAELTLDQQANLRDFVNVRGGALLMLAGRSGLADGGWGRSALAPALPVVLSARTGVQDYQRTRVGVQLTEQGARMAWMDLLDPEDDSGDADRLAAWDDLPELADVQELGTVKPAAVVLLESGTGQDAKPLLVWHRYGQGQTYVLGTSGTWRWQMRLPSEDQRHERFWQQLLGHLSASALPQMTLLASQAVHRDSATVPIAVLARRADYTPLEAGRLDVQLRSPNGVRTEVTLLPDINQPGRFVGSVATPDTGPWSVALSGPSSGEALPAGSDRGADDKPLAEHWWVQESGTAEFFNAFQHQAFLQRLAEETGGSYLTVDSIGELPGLLALENAALTREDIRPLWNMPILFLLLLLLKGIEWLLRLRWKRL